jgi:acyl-coenzyme A thioesterase PaaI-like protein
VVTRFTPLETHQGPPGVMHGGLVFTIADELAAWAVITAMGKFGFTARHEGRFKRPTRIGVPLEGRGRITRSTGRTADVAVTLSQEGAVCYEASFTFAVLDRGATEKMLGQPLPETWARWAR